jgi:hypothetical protein
MNRLHSIPSLNGMVMIRVDSDTMPVKATIYTSKQGTPLPIN